MKFDDIFGYLVALGLGGILAEIVKRWQPPKIRQAELERMRSESDALDMKILIDLRTQVAGLVVENSELRDRIRKLENVQEDEGRKYNLIFAYLVANIDRMIESGVHPVPVPNELKTDPELIRLVNRMKDGDSGEPKE